MPVEIDFDATSPSNISFLKSVSELRFLNELNITRLAAKIKRRLYEDGEEIFHEGDLGTHLFILQEGLCGLDLHGKIVKHIRPGDFFGELAIIGGIKRAASVRSKGKSIVLFFPATVLDDGETLSVKAAIALYKELTQKITRYTRDEEVFYNDMDVLLVQDGGCAPGYNSVTGYITRFLEYSGRRVFVAREGFRSLVNGTINDFNYLINDRYLYTKFDHIPGVVFAPPYREARGASFRSERYKEFIEEKNQKKAAQHIIERKVKVIIGIGGDGTLKGMKALSRFLPDSIRMFFVPVTIDSDIFGTECIGEHTGVQVGSEKIRSYMADARSHQRLYVIEMMGRDGGYHALRSCLGAGADLAVLPSFEYDYDIIAKSLQRKQSAVIVVAEGYKRDQRKTDGFVGNAAEYFLHQLMGTGHTFKMKGIAEGFSRDIRGAAPNYNDIALSQQMARYLSELIEQGENMVMPAVLGGKEYAIPFDQIQTDNTVNPRLAELANRLF